MRRRGRFQHPRFAGKLPPGRCSRIQLGDCDFGALFQAVLTRPLSPQPPLAKQHDNLIAVRFLSDL